MSYYPDFAALLNENLARLDRSPAWLARQLGVNPSTVNRWLNHESRPGDPETVARVADVLGLTSQLQTLLVAAGYGYQEKPSNDGQDHNALATAASEDAAPGAEETQTEGRVHARPLPIQATPFVGRVEELSQIEAWLNDPAVRLVTVLGPGGMGKTRLALMAAEHQLERGQFADGVFFVTLATITTRQAMLTAIADTLGLSSAGSDLETTLLNQLRARHLLIVLDNFEQLLAESDFVATLLSIAPLGKLVVTSRERLNLQEEWVLDLLGLGYPPAMSVDDWDRYDAVRLFIQRIEQVNSGFVPTTEQMTPVIQICRLVQGMPLGLELAAGWTRAMSLAEIGAELAQNLDFFATTMRNVPERHRSLRAVFRQSWQMLIAAERDAFAALSVFRGGFDRQAATQVTGVAMPVLASLVDKSLLRHTQNGRYEIHELLRQYGAEKLAEASQRQETVRLAHAAYYCHFLHAREENLHGGGQLEAIAAIRMEQENVRVAWYTAVDECRFALVAQAVDGWFNFCELGGHPQQGIQGLTHALQVIEGTPENLAHEADITVRALPARTLARHAYLLIRTGGSHHDSNEELERSLALLAALHGQDGIDLRYELAFVQNTLGLWSYITGEKEPAERYVRNALTVAEEIGHSIEIARAWLYLGHLAEFQGRFSEAVGLFTKSIEIYRQAGELNRYAYGLNNWARACYGMGEYDQAEALIRRGLRIREEFNDLIGISFSLLDLARVADCRGDYGEAKRLMQEGLALTHTVTNYSTSVRYLLGLGDVALHKGETNSAKAYLEDAYQLCQELAIGRHVPTCLTGLGWVALQQKDLTSAKHLFEKSLRLLQTQENVGEEAMVRIALAHLALEQSQRQDAARHLLHCLAIGSETGARPAALEAIALATHCLADGASPELPAHLALLRLVARHQATWHHTRVRVEAQLAQAVGLAASSHDEKEDEKEESEESNDESALWSEVDQLRRALGLLVTAA